MSSDECVCPVAQYCERHKKKMTKLHWGKCQSGLSNHLAAMYSNTVLHAKPASLYVRKFGPGNQLHRLLKQRFNVAPSLCSCTAWIAKMNHWGTTGCEEHLEEIVDHLLDEAKVNKQTPLYIRAALQFPIIGEIEGRRRIRELVQEAIHMPVPVGAETDVKDPLAHIPLISNNGSGLITEHLRSLKSLLSQQMGTAEVAEGDGVLTVGGGKYWPGIVVMIKMLRSSGCNLPVQVWYRGHHEPVEPLDIEGVDGVTLVDIEQRAKDEGGYRVMGGWQAKAWALVRCGFRRCLYLDADAYCVADPTPMFELLEEDSFLFWSDLEANYRTINWAEVWPDGDAGVPAVQGGQLFLHLEKLWPLMCVANWMNQHSDYYYRRMFGDQDVWRVLLAAMKGVKWRNLGPAPWVNVAFVLSDMQGDPLIVHRCQGKLFPPEHIPKDKLMYSNPQYSVLPKESEVFSLLAPVMSRGRTPERVFESIYANQLWGGGSGAGSSVREATPYITFVRQFMLDNHLTSISDAGCGDGAVAHMFGRKVRYAGVDCCQSMITKLTRRFPEKTWLKGDFLNEPDCLPAADILLCKDVLHHWPSEAILRFLTWLESNMRWKVVLFTQDYYQRESGADTHLGGYRALAENMAPLNRFAFQVLTRYNQKAVLQFRP